MQNGKAPMNADAQSIFEFLELADWKINMKKTVIKSQAIKLDYLLICLSGLAFWYAYYCFDMGAVELRGSQFEMHESSFLFWSGIVFVIGFGLYLLYLVFMGSEE